MNNNELFLRMMADFSGTPEEFGELLAQAKGSDVEKRQIARNVIRLLDGGFEFLQTEEMKLS